MKRFICVMIILLLMFSFSACNISDEAKGFFEDASIVLNEYDKLPDEEWKEVLSIVENKFNTWPGFVMHYIEDVYVGTNTSYCEMLSNGVEFDMCIILKSSFTTGENAWSGFSENVTYEDFNWYLARTKDGEWQLVEYGVG